MKIKSILTFALILSSLLLAIQSACALDIMLKNGTSNSNGTLANGTVSQPWFVTSDNSTDDDSLVFKSALNAIVSAGGGTLIVPAGKYHFRTRAEVNLNEKLVTIAGQGKWITEIHSLNAAGIFFFNNTGAESQLRVLDLCFLADLADSGDTTAFEDSGTALRMNNASLSVNTSGTFSSICVWNVSIQPSDWANPDPLNSFYNGITGGNLLNASFTDVLFSDRPGKGTATGGTPAVPGHCGFLINGAKNISLESCHAKHAEKDFYFINLQGTVSLVACNAVGGDIGMTLSGAEGAACNVTLAECHTNTYIKGINANAISNLTIKNIVALTTKWSGNSAQPSYTDCFISNCGTVDIRDVQFSSANNFSRTNIVLNGSLTGASIKNCIFNSNPMLNQPTIRAVVRSGTQLLPMPLISPATTYTAVEVLGYPSDVTKSGNIVFSNAVYFPSAGSADEPNE